MPSTTQLLALLSTVASVAAKDLLGLERCEGGEFFESGPLKDEELSLSQGEGGRRVQLSTPIRLKGRDYYSVFLSPQGVIGLGHDFDSHTRKGWGGLPWRKAFVAPFWTDEARYSHGSIFYRESSARLYLDRADRQLDYQGFKYRGGRRIQTRSVFIVTFLDLKKDAWRNEEGHSFQVTFYATNAGTFANFIFGNIDEYGLRGQEGGISAGDGSEFYRFPFKGGQARLLSLLGNTSTKGNWLLRIDERSGTSACLPHAKTVDICSTTHSLTHESYCEPRRLRALQMGGSSCRRECEALLSCPRQKKATSTWLPRWKRARSPRRRPSRPQPPPRRSWQPRRSSWRSSWGG